MTSSFFPLDYLQWLHKTFASYLLPLVARTATIKAIPEAQSSHLPKYSGVSTSGETKHYISSCRFLNNEGITTP